MNAKSTIKFSCLEEAEIFKAENAPYLVHLEQSLLQQKGVASVEVWLNKNTASAVVAFDHEGGEVGRKNICMEELIRIKKNEMELSAKWDMCAQEQPERFNELCVMTNESS